MRISQFSELRTELGGGSFLDPKLYMLIALATAPLAGLFGRDSQTFGEFLLYLFANIASIAITAFPFFIIRGTKDLLKIDFSLLAVLGTGAILGFTKAFSTAHLVSSLELEGIDDALKSRLASGVMIGIFIVLLFSALPVLIERFERERIALVRATVATELAATVRPLIEETKTKLAELEALDLKATSMADELIDFSNSVLRPKLLELWSHKAETYPSFELREIVRYSFRHTPIPLLPYAIVIGLGTMTRGNYELLGFLAFAFFLSNLLAVSLGALASNALKKSGKPVLALVIMIGSNGTALAVFNQANNPATDPTLFLTNFVLASLFAAIHSQVTTVLASGLMAAARQEKEQAEFEGSLANSPPMEVAKVLAARRAAEILHGQVQSWILASAIRIRQDPGQASVELATLKSQIADSHIEQREQVPVDFEAQITEVWGGIMSVNIQIPGSLQILDVASQEVIIEALNNARKHGSATRVEVRILGDNKPDHITVIDNGSGPNRERRGIGSALLTTLGFWKLTKNSLGGATLELTFHDSARPS